MEVTHNCGNYTVLRIPFEETCLVGDTKVNSVNLKLNEIIIEKSELVGV